MTIIKQRNIYVLYNDTEPAGAYDFPPGSILLTPKARYFFGTDKVFHKIQRSTEPEPAANVLGTAALGAIVLE